MERKLFLLALLAVAFVVGSAVVSFAAANRLILLTEQEPSVSFSQHVPIQVRYVDPDGQPLPDKFIGFESQGDMADSDLRPRNALTDTDGVAESTIISGLQEVDFDVRISVPDDDAVEPLNIRVRIQPKESTDYIISVTYSGVLRLDRVEVLLYLLDETSGDCGSVVAHPTDPPSLDDVWTRLVILPDEEGNIPARGLNVPADLELSYAVARASLLDPVGDVFPFGCTDYILSRGTVDPPITVAINMQDLVSDGNSPPKADAGPDQAIVLINSIVQLDGTQSYDDDGDIITYSWTIVSKPEGSLALLSDPTSAEPTFVADVYGDYTIQLIVSDPWEPSAADTITVSFQNVKPMAVAGGNQWTIVYEVVSLSGINSYDENGDALAYSWRIVSKPADSLTELSDPTLIDPTLVPDMPGEYVVRLIVNDGFIDSEPSNLTVMAISKKDATIEAVGEISDLINALGEPVFQNIHRRKPLANKINAVLGMIDQRFYQEARDKLGQDILRKTNGCAEQGSPERNDWITDCEAQGQVYPLILDAIVLLNSLI